MPPPTSTPTVEQYFRIAEPGSRPDTVVLRNVPADWFGITMKSTKAQYSGKDAPLRRAMVKFGPVRCVATAHSAALPCATAKPFPTCLRVLTRGLVCSPLCVCFL